MLAFFFTATIEVLKVALGPVLGNDMVVVPSAGALTAMLIAPVGGWIERRVELWSRRGLIALARDLPAAARDLGEQDDPALLFDHACRRVRRAMQAQAVAIIARDGAGWASARVVGAEESAITGWLASAAHDRGRTDAEVVREDALFPLRVPLVAHPTGEPEAIAWLLVGRRPDGSIQDKDARETLAGVAPALGPRPARHRRAPASRCGLAQSHRSALRARGDARKATGRRPARRLAAPQT